MTRFEAYTGFHVGTFLTLRVVKCVPKNRFFYQKEKVIH